MSGGDTYGLLSAGTEQWRTSMRALPIQFHCGVPYLALADWVDLGVRLFGVDRDRWEFRCPHCGHVQSVLALRDMPGCERVFEWVHSHCAGRYLTGGRCDWRANETVMATEYDVLIGTTLTPTFAFARRDVIYPRVNEGRHDA